LGDNRDSELDRAREVWQKKFSAAPADAAEKAKQMRFLQSRGFTPEVIRRAIASGSDLEADK
jgi:regulatory protein